MARVKKKKAPEGFRWKTVTVPSTRPGSFTTKRVLVPIEVAEEVSVDAPALDMFDVPAPVTQALGPWPGQAVDPDVDRTPVVPPRSNLLQQQLEDTYGRFDPYSGIGTGGGMKDPTWAGVTERHVRDIAGLPSTPEGLEDYIAAQKSARRREVGGSIPPPKRKSVYSADPGTMFAEMGDQFYVKTGVRPEYSVGPMAGPVRKVVTNLAKAAKDAVITSGAKKTVAKATTELGKRIRGEVQETATRTGRTTVPLEDRIKLEAAKIQARKEGFPSMTATEVFPPVTSRLGSKPLRTTPEVSRLLWEGPTPGRRVTTPPVSQDFQRTNLYKTGVSLKDRIEAQVRKGTAVKPAPSLATTTVRGSPIEDRIRAQVAAVNAARTQPTLAERIRRDVSTSRSAVPVKTLEERIRAEAARVAAAKRVPPATVAHDPGRLRPDIVRKRSVAKTLGTVGALAGLGVGIDQFLKMERAEDQTQAAIDAAVQAKKDIVEGTESGLLERGTAGRGGVSQDIGKLPKVGKGSDADQIATNPNLEKIWGKYAYDPKARAKKFNEGMNSIWKKMALLNAIAVMTGNKSMAPAYMEMATARLDRMDKFDEEARVSSIWKEVFTGPNGGFYMPKNKTEAAERAAKAGGSPTTIKDIFGAVPKKPTPVAATGYVTWTDGKENIPLKKGELGPEGYWVGKAGSEGGGQYERAASKAREHIIRGGENAQGKALSELLQYYGSTKDAFGALMFKKDVRKLATDQLQNILVTMDRAEGEVVPSIDTSGVSDKKYSREEADQMIRRANPIGDTPRDEYEKSIEDELKRLGY